ncbi:MAG: XdhC family protein [Acidimicrobiales bacterium]
MREIALAALQAADDERRGRVARVVAFKGFGGRRAGEAVLIYEDGSTAGHLLGGLADSAVQEAADATLFDLAIGDSNAVAAGLACGGVATVLVSDIASVPRGAWDAIAGGVPTALVSLTGTHAEGHSVLALVDERRTSTMEEYGSLGEAGFDDLGREAARLALRQGREMTELHASEGRTIVVEVLVSATTLVVIGDGALTKALSSQGALLGWAVVVEQAWHDQVAARVRALGPNDALVVLSHDARVDTPALALGLSGSAYVGALGSRHTQAGRRERLQALGSKQESLDRIHGPVGLDVGARTPEETAVAIVAEILAHRSGRSGSSLRAASGAING